MEKNKNKKKLFAIIAASALAFVLTVALSVSITLAYFGGKAEGGTTTVTMDKAVTVGTSVTTDTTIENALPGQKVALSATATVNCGSNGAFLAAKVEQGGTGKDSIGATFAATGWKLVGDYYYYVGATGDSATAPVKMSDDDEATIGGDVILSTRLTNAVAEETLTLKVTFIAVQGVVYDDAGVATTATFENVLPMITQIMTAA